MASFDQDRLGKAAALCALAFGIFLVLAAYALFSMSEQTSAWAPSGMPPSPTYWKLLLPAMALLLAALFIYFALSLYAGRQIEIALDKPEFALGEAITGTITLNLRKEKLARSLTVIFMGHEKQGKGTAIICQSQCLVSPGRTFSRKEALHFSIRMPPEVRDFVDPPLEPANNMASLESAFAFQPRWFVKARLDVQGGVDIEHEVPVKIVSGR